MFMKIIRIQLLMKIYIRIYIVTVYYDTISNLIIMD
jgi:hypothetical protein